MRTIRSLAVSGIIVMGLTSACSDSGDDLAIEPTTSSAAPSTTSTERAAKPAVPTTTARSSDTCTGLRASAPVPVVSDPILTEISGAVVSDRTPGALWLHEDSGDDATLTEVGSDGRVVSQWSVPDVDPTDWEDIGAASDSVGTRHLFVGDIGDNQEQRPFVEVVRIPEPLAPGVGGASERAAVLTLRYPAGARNAEALLIDPGTADIVVVTKSITGSAEVLVAREGAWLDSGAELQLELVGTLSLGVGQAVLAGDISPDADRVALRTPGRVLLWAHDAADRSLTDTLLGAEPCRAPSVFEIQGEAIALTADGYVLVGEGDAPELRPVT